GWGSRRAASTPPGPSPTPCAPQARAAAAPLLLVRAFLGLQPDGPERRLAVAPHLPGRWGQLRLRQLRLGPVTADITATGGDATVEGLPEGWTRTGTTG